MKTVLFSALIGSVSAPAQVIKIACIGNSITAGGYPQKLGNLLGSGFSVENDGVSGTTLLKKGDYSYWIGGKLTQVRAFKPSIITIKLGTNDSKPQNWSHKAEFEADLRAMIDSLEKWIVPKPVIWLCLPVPAWPVNGTNPFGIDGSIILNEQIPIIKKVAASRNLKVIDLHTALLPHKSFFSDGVHPNAQGQDSIAANIYRALTKVTTGVAAQKRPLFSDKQFSGGNLNIMVPRDLPAGLQILDMLGRSVETQKLPNGWMTAKYLDARK